MDDVEAHLEQLEALVAEARPLPLSGLVMVHREEVEACVDDVRTALPDDLREARWLLRDRDEVLAAAAREREELLAAAAREAAAVRAEAEADAERMRSQTEVLRTARREAERVRAEARDDARRLQREAEEYVEQRLAAFEAVLQRTMNVAARGRQRLREGLGAPDLVDLGDDAAQLGSPRPAQLFDQERVAAPRSVRS